MLLFAVVSTIAAFAVAPTYRATVIMVPASEERGSELLGSTIGQLGGLAALAGVNIGSNRSDTEESLAVLRSREFTERFIVDNGLMQKIFARKWDAENGKWRGSKADQPTPARAYKQFDQKVRSLLKTGEVV